MTKPVSNTCELLLNAPKEDQKEEAIMSCKTAAAKENSVDVTIEAVYQNFTAFSAMVCE